MLQQHRRHGRDELRGVYQSGHSEIHHLFGGDTQNEGNELYTNCAHPQTEGTPTLMRHHTCYTWVSCHCSHMPLDVKHLHPHAHASSNPLFRRSSAYIFRGNCDLLEYIHAFEQGLQHIQGVHHLRLFPRPVSPFAQSSYGLPTICFRLDVGVLQALLMYSWMIQTQTPESKSSVFLRFFYMRWLLLRAVVLEP